MNKSPLSEDLILARWPSALDGHLHYCIGFSGGIDSVVLLHLFNKLRTLRSLNISAIHINHGISANSDYWQGFCVSLCHKLDIPLRIARLKVSKIPGQGLENSARKARYQEYLQSQADVIVLAHHEDDQVETMLSQLMRGSDVHNLSAMHELTQKQQQYYWRPLLNISKKQILTYAKEEGLSNIEDESNKDNQYLRNFLRNRIIPELSGYDPHLMTKLTKTIGSIQAATRLNDELAEEDFMRCITKEESAIELNVFASLSHLRQINLLNYFIRQHELALPSQNQIKEFIRQVLNATPDRHPQLRLSGITEKTLLRNSKMIIIINS